MCFSEPTQSEGFLYPKFCKIYKMLKHSSNVQNQSHLVLDTSTGTTAEDSLTISYFSACTLLQLCDFIKDRAMHVLNNFGDPDNTDRAISQIITLAEIAGKIIDPENIQTKSQNPQI